MSPVVKIKTDNILKERHVHLLQTSKGPAPPRPVQAGLCISVYEPNKSKIAGVPTLSLVYWTGLAVVLMIQMLVAAIPFAISGDESILVITLSGTIFALMAGSLSQWKAEKWACRRKLSSPYILTTGNGAQHVILILGNRTWSQSILKTPRQDRCVDPPTAYPDFTSPLLLFPGSFCS